MPDVTVVVPSHNRRLRLRWLLNSLEEQSIDHELIVVHTYDAATATELFDDRPHVRHIHVAKGSPAKQRNLGWRAASCDLVAFTDDDCRADIAWLSELVRVARAHPGRIVQGATRNEPFETDIHAAPHVRSLHIDPVSPFAQTCNILYPKPVLERVGGFDEAFPGPAGEDLDLAIRAGRDIVAAPEAVVFHAVEEYPLWKMIRLNNKWGDVAFVVGRYPEVRSQLTWRVFWRPEHRDVALAVAGLALRKPVLAAPYVWRALNARPSKAVAAAELPGRFLIDAAEVVSLIRGSIRHRTFVL